MDDITGKLPEFMDSKSSNENALLSYVKTMDQDTITQLSRPASSEVMQVMGALNAGGFANVGLVTDTGGPALDSETN